MLPIYHRRLNTCLLILAALSLPLHHLHADPPTSSSQPTASPEDVTAVKKTFETLITAMMHDDAAAFKTCIYLSDPADAPVLDAIIVQYIAKHQLGQAAVAAFGPDGTSLYSVQAAYDDDLKKTFEKIQHSTVEIHDGLATLRIKEEFETTEQTCRKIDGLWKLDEDRSFASSAQDRQTQIATMLAAAHLMDDLTQQIKAGAFKDVEEVKAARALKQIAAAPPTTAPAETNDPGERWLKKAAQPGLSPLQKAAYEQLAQLHLANLQQYKLPGRFATFYPAQGSNNAFLYLSSMGLDAVPILAETLDDTTLTKTVTTSGSGEKYERHVNELTSDLIARICGRDFEADDQPGQPNFLTIDRLTPNMASHAPQFQKAILDWYKLNRHRTELDRKLADLDDKYHGIRFTAVTWLVQKKETKAVPALIKYIDKTLTALDSPPNPGKPNDDLPTTADAPEYAYALAQIGDPAGLPAVKKLCQHLSAAWDKRHKPQGDMDITDLFQAYHALALLGEKDAALKELTRIHDTCNAEMSESSKKEFNNNLRLTAKW